MKAFLRRLLPITIGLAVCGAIGYAFLPQPVRVDLAAVNRGPLQVTVEENGKTRIRDRYIVSSPLQGRLLRIQLEPGDAVDAGKTCLAVIEPGDPALLDPRARAETEARVKAAEARLHQAGTALDQALAALQFAEVDLSRIRGLNEHGGSTQHELDSASMRFRMRSEDHRGARFAEEIARFELEQARAALLRTAPRGEASSSSAVNLTGGKGSSKSVGAGAVGTGPVGTGAVVAGAVDPGEHASDDWFFPIRSPINGRVLRKYQESSTIVTPGTQLLQIGDPENLEVEVDVLSADGVRITSGDQVLLEQWGGEKPLIGRVRLVEPSAFTKISSLGVEEQRVNVRIDFETPPAERRTLGDAFRVETKIIIWQKADVLRVPIGALFRHGDEWAVFCVRDGRARRQIVSIGHRNALDAEVIAGVEDHEQVVLHPSDQVVDGVHIVSR